MRERGLADWRSWFARWGISVPGFSVREPTESLDGGDRVSVEPNCRFLGQMDQIVRAVVSIPPENLTCH